MPQYSVVILGATSAIARAVAFEFARDGYKLILAGRDDEQTRLVAEDIRIRFDVEAVPIHFDAADFGQHETAFQAMAGAAGDRLAGVVLCFGTMAPQAEAQADPAVARRIIDINLTGAVSMLEPFAAIMESNRTGFLAVLSSVAGDRGRQSNYLYGAAKAGLTTYLEGLRNRLHPAGVTVTTVKPGFVDTKMTYGLPGLFLVASPEKAAKDIVRAIRRRKDVVYVPFFWRYIMGIIKAVPEWKFKRMKL